MSKYETFAGRPSKDQTYAKLVEQLRDAQDQANLLGHMMKEDGNETNGQGLLAVAELLGRAAVQIQKLATGSRTGLIIQ